jgi:hypothetical protein
LKGREALERICTKPLKFDSPPNQQKECFPPKVLALKGMRIFQKKWPT